LKRFFQVAAGVVICAVGFIEYKIGHDPAAWHAARLRLGAMVLHRGMAASTVRRLLGDEDRSLGEAAFDGKIGWVGERWDFNGGAAGHPLYLHLMVESNRATTLQLWYWDHPFPPKPRRASP
jgi:hypothetical protein